MSTLAWLAKVDATLEDERTVNVRLYWRPDQNPESRTAYGAVAIIEQERHAVEAEATLEVTDLEACRIWASLIREGLAARALNAELGL